MPYHDAEGSFLMHHCCSFCVACCVMCASRLLQACCSGRGVPFSTQECVYSALGSTCWNGCKHRGEGNYNLAAVCCFMLLHARQRPKAAPLEGHQMEVLKGQLWCEGFRCVPRSCAPVMVQNDQQDR